MPGLFPIGNRWLTPEALVAFLAADQDPDLFIRRHSQGDWGEVSVTMAAKNRQALESEGPVVSAYRLRTGVRIRLVTGGDRTRTTISISASPLQ